MANELLIDCFLRFKKGNMTPEMVESRPLYQTVTGDVHSCGRQSIGLTAEVIAKPADMGTIGIVYIRNEDTTNFVEVGDDADNPSIKLEPGQFFLAPWGATNVSCKADTAACVVLFKMFEL